MAAIMVEFMDILDAQWIESYFAEVPSLLADYGALSLAASRDACWIEGGMPAPDRTGIFHFPSMDVAEQFVADARYRSFRDQRRAGLRSRIFAFLHFCI